MKKILRIICIAALILQSSLITVHSVHWADDILNRVVKKGYMNGYEDGTLKPNKKITRGEFLTMLNRVTNSTKVSGYIWLDYNENDPFNKQADIAYTAGFVKGYPDKSLRLQENITREEACVMLEYAFNAYTDENGIEKFDDSSDISSWAKEAMECFYACGVINGYENNTLRGKEYISRAETATIFDKLSQRVISSDCNIKDEEISGNVIIVSGNNFNFSNVKINGNVFILNGVTDGKVTFENSSLDGGLYFVNNGKNDVFVNDSQINLTVFDEKNEKSALTVSGKSQIDNGVFEADTSINSINLTGRGIINETVEKNVEIFKTVSKANEPAPKKESLSVSGGVGGGPSSSGSSNIGNTTVKNYILKSVVTQADDVISPEFKNDVYSYTVNVPYNHNSTNITFSFDGYVKCKINGTEIQNNVPFTVENLEYATPKKVDLEVYSGIKKEKTYSFSFVRTNIASYENLVKFNVKIGSLQEADFTSCSINYVTNDLLTAYNEKLSKKKSQLGRNLTQSEIQDTVNSINSSAAILKNICVYTENEEKSILGESFSSSKTDYRVYVGEATTNVKLKVEKLFANSSVLINNQEYTDTVTLNVQYGDNTATITVNSEDRESTKNYAVTVVRDSDTTNKLANAFFDNEKADYQVENGTMEYEAGTLKLNSTQTASFTSQLETTIKRNTDVKLSFVSRCDNGRVKLFVEQANGIRVYSNSLSVTAFNEYTFDYTAMQNESIKCGIEYTGALELAYFKLCHKSENCNVEDISLGDDFELTSEIHDENETLYIFKTENQNLTEATLTLTGETDVTFKIGTTPNINTKDITLTNYVTDVNAQAQALSGTYRDLKIKIIRPMKESDYPEDEYLEKINTSNNLKRADLTRCKLVNIDTSLVDDYIVAIYANRKFSNVLEVQAIIDNVNKIKPVAYEAEDYKDDRDAVIEKSSGAYVKGASAKYIDVLSGSIVFNNIYVPTDGIYSVKLHYLSKEVARDRTISIFTKDAEYKTAALSFNPVAGWCIAEFAIPLEEGNNTLVLPFDGTNPNLYVDYIRVSKYEMKLPLRLESETDATIQTSGTWQIKNSNGEIIAYRGKHTFTVMGVSGEYKMTLRCQNVTQDVTHKTFVTVNGSKAWETLNFNSSGEATENLLVTDTVNITLKDGINEIVLENSKNFDELYVDYIIIDKK